MEPRYLFFYGLHLIREPSVQEKVGHELVNKFTSRVRRSRLPPGITLDGAEMTARVEWQAIQKVESSLAQGLNVQVQVIQDLLDPASAMTLLLFGPSGAENT